MDDSSRSDTSSSPDKIIPLIPLRKLFPHLSEFYATNQPSTSTARQSRSRKREVVCKPRRRRHQVTPLVIPNPKLVINQQPNQTQANVCAVAPKQPQRASNSRPGVPSTSKTPNPIPRSSASPISQPRTHKARSSASSRVKTRKSGSRRTVTPLPQISMPMSPHSPDETHNLGPPPSPPLLPQARARKSKRSRHPHKKTRKPDRRTPFPQLSISMSPLSPEDIRDRVPQLSPPTYFETREPMGSGYLRPQTTAIVFPQSSISMSPLPSEEIHNRVPRLSPPPFFQPRGPMETDHPSPRTATPSPPLSIPMSPHSPEESHSPGSSKTASPLPQPCVPMLSPLSPEETHNPDPPTTASPPPQSCVPMLTPPSPEDTHNPGPRTTASPLPQLCVPVISLLSPEETHSPGSCTSVSPLPQPCVPIISLLSPEETHNPGPRSPTPTFPQPHGPMPSPASPEETPAGGPPSARAHDMRDHSNTDNVETRNADSPPSMVLGMDESSSDAQFPDRSPMPTAERFFESLPPNNDEMPTDVQHNPVPPTRVLYTLPQRGENMQAPTYGGPYQLHPAMANQQGLSSCGPANTMPYQRLETGPHYVPPGTYQGRDELAFAQWMSQYGRSQPNLITTAGIVSPKSLLADATSRLRHMSGVLLSYASINVTRNRYEPIENRPRSEMDISEQPQSSYMGNSFPRQSYIPGTASLYQSALESHISNILVPGMANLSDNNAFQSSRCMIPAVNIEENNLRKAAETLTVIGAFNDQLQNIENLVAQIVHEPQQRMPTPGTFYGNTAVGGTARDTPNMFPGTSTMWQRPPHQNVLPGHRHPVPNLNMPMAPLEIQNQNVDFERYTSANPNPYSHRTSYNVNQHFFGATPTSMNPSFANTRDTYGDIAGPQSSTYRPQSMEPFTSPSYPSNQSFTDSPADLNRIPMYQPAAPPCQYCTEEESVTPPQPIPQHQAEVNINAPNTHHALMPRPNCNCAICSAFRLYPHLTPNSAVEHANRMANTSENEMIYQRQPSNSSGSPAQFVPQESNTPNLQYNDRSASPFMERVEEHNFGRDPSYRGSACNTAQQANIHTPSSDLQSRRTPTIPNNNTYVRAVSTMMRKPTFRRETENTTEDNARPIRPRRPVVQQQLPAPHNQNAEGEQSQAAPPNRPGTPAPLQIFCLARNYANAAGASPAIDAENDGGNAMLMHIRHPGDRPIVVPIRRLRLMPRNPSEQVLEGNTSPHSPDSNMPML